MVVNKAHSLLVQLGLGDYEARAYIGLLEIQPATAYELAKQTGIPNSKIYEIVSRLEEKALFLAINADKKRGKQYCAIGVEDFIERKQAETAQQTALLAKALEPNEHEPVADIIWPLTDRLTIFTKAASLIERCQQSCLISLWPEELQELREPLLNAEARGIKIALVHFGIPKEQIGATYYHPAEETLYEEKKGRGLTLVCDNEQVLTATFYKNGDVQGNWSQNRTFVTVAEDYIRHDVYITKVTTRLEQQMKQEFGENYAQLRDIFTA